MVINCDALGALFSVHPTDGSTSLTLMARSAAAAHSPVGTILKIKAAPT
jgi:hypothetical protein